MAAVSRALHTGGMPDDARATAFETGADGLPCTKSVTLRLDVPDEGATRRVFSFDEAILPHLDAAFRLARWLVGNEHDAEDVVQEACLRALRYFRTFSTGKSRAWFLKIVRHTCYDWHSQTRQPPSDVFDEERHSGATLTTNPETLMLRASATALIERTMTELPDRFRDILVLREIEGLSYQELADVLGIPIGSVMSRLSRARRAFRRALDTRLTRPDDTPLSPAPPGFTR